MGASLGALGFIDAVTVFRRGALVRRVVPLEAGLRALRLGPLPRALEDESIRVEVRGGEAREMRVVLALFDDDPALPTATDEALDAARLALGRAEARVRSREDALAALAGITLEPRNYGEDGPSQVPTEARLELASLRAKRSAALNEELDSLREQLRDAREAAKLAEERAKNASSARQARANELRKGVDLSFAEATTEGEVTLEYLVPGARWAPTYTLHLDEALREARLERRALIAQRTGEDWRGVALRLSTAEPARWRSLPKVPSIRIGRRQPAPARAWRPPPEGAEALFADFDRAFPPRAPTRQPVAEAPPAPRMAAPPAPRTPPPPPMGAVAVGPPSALMGAVAVGPPPAVETVESSLPMPERAAAAPKSAKMMSRARVAPAPARPQADSRKEREEDAPPIVELALAAELLVYARLRLPDPSASERGRLRAISPAEAWSESAGGAAPPSRLRALVEGAVHRADELAPLPPGVREAHAEDGFDHAFDVGHRVDVSADGQWQGVVIGEEALRSEPSLVVVPRESADVHRYVALEGFAAPVLRGPVDLYIDGRYHLGHTLSPAPRGASVRLGLGVEPNVRVARNVRFEERSAGLMGRALELVHDVEVELRSSLSTEAMVEVRERVPVARERDDEVEVREEHVEPAWEAWKPDALDPGQPALDGGRRWKVRVPPGGTRALHARWLVRIPSKNELVGGNRREP